VSTRRPAKRPRPDRGTGYPPPVARIHARHDAGPGTPSPPRKGRRPARAARTSRPHTGRGPVRRRQRLRASGGRGGGHASALLGQGWLLEGRSSDDSGGHSRGRPAAAVTPAQRPLRRRSLRRQWPLRRRRSLERRRYSSAAVTRAAAATPTAATPAAEAAERGRGPRLDSARATVRTSGEPISMSIVVTPRPAFDRPLRSCLPQVATLWISTVDCPAPVASAD